MATPVRFTLRSGVMVCGFTSRTIEEVAEIVGTRHTFLLIAKRVADLYRYNSITFRPIWVATAEIAVVEVDPDVGGHEKTVLPVMFSALAKPE